MLLRPCNRNRIVSTALYKPVESKVTYMHIQNKGIALPLLALNKEHLREVGVAHKEVVLQWHASLCAY